MNGTEGNNTMNGTEGAYHSFGPDEKVYSRQSAVALLESLLGRGNGVVGFVVGGAHG